MRLVPVQPLRLEQQVPKRILFRESVPDERRIDCGVVQGDFVFSVIFAFGAVEPHGGAVERERGR